MAGCRGTRPLQAIGSASPHVLRLLSPFLTSTSLANIVVTGQTTRHEHKPMRKYQMTALMVQLTHSQLHRFVVYRRPLYVLQTAFKYGDATAYLLCYGPYTVYTGLN
jgi:hypothetical protein